MCSKLQSLPAQAQRLRNNGHRLVTGWTGLLSTTCCATSFLVSSCIAVAASFSIAHAASSSVRAHRLEYTPLIEPTRCSFTRLGAFAPINTYSASSYLVAQCVPGELASLGTLFGPRMPASFLTQLTAVRCSSSVIGQRHRITSYLVLLPGLRGPKEFAGTTQPENHGPAKTGVRTLRDNQVRSALLPALAVAQHCANHVVPRDVLRSWLALRSISWPQRHDLERPDCTPPPTFLLGDHPPVASQ